MRNQPGDRRRSGGRDRRRRRTSWRARLALGVICGLAAGLFQQGPAGWGLEQKGLNRPNRLFLLRGPLPPPGDIVIVAVDEPSFQELGLQWPWPRSLHARLLDRLRAAGARAVALDILFAGPSSPAEDAALARAAFIAAGAAAAQTPPAGQVIWVQGTLEVTRGAGVRLAAFQNFQTPSHTVLSPTHLAGFFIDAPIPPSSVGVQYHAAWDAELTATTFATVQGFRREIDVPTYETRPAGQRERRTVPYRRTGFSAAVNQVLWDHWGLSAGYILAHREGSGEHDGHDQLFRVGLTFVYPFGYTGGAISAGATWAYVTQDIGSAPHPLAPKDFWVGTVGATYERPDKWGSFGVTVENPFKERFDFQGVAGSRNDLVLTEVPDLRVLARLRVNF